ncbi:hypothetical protein MSPP1_000681 [Malassezia sp. CBS 17886]|nr:hypothetical protein MSPP1_000681 [Malassezia sp. CBS 17886]
MRVGGDEFLSRLAALFESAQEKHSVYVTVKRSAQGDAPPSGADTYPLLFRASDGVSNSADKAKFATLVCHGSLHAQTQVPPADIASFMDAYRNVVRTQLAASLRKRDKARERRADKLLGASRKRLEENAGKVPIAGAKRGAGRRRRMRALHRAKRVRAARTRAAPHTSFGRVMLLPAALVRSEVPSTVATLLLGFSLGPVLSLVGVTLSSILQVFVVCGVGYALALQGILDKRTQALNVSIFTPALLFSKVAFSLTPERLSQLVIVPFGFVVVSIFSAFAAYLISWVLRIPGGQRNFVIACSITPNSNSLPIALIQSLVITVPELHWVRNGNDVDTTDDMLGRALTYLVLFSTLSTVQRWSIGADLMRRVKTPVVPVVERRGRGFADDVTDFLSDRRHRESLAQSVSSQRSSLYLGADASMEGAIQLGVPDVSRLQRIGRTLRSAWSTFLGFMTVPLWAALASFLVALTPPLQANLVKITALVDMINDVGACSIPITILVLGGYFAGDHARPPESASASDIQERVRPEPGTHDYTTRTIVAATLSRMVITPLLFLPVFAYVCLVSRNTVVDDPVFIACACLVIGSPPALTLAQITAQHADPTSNVEDLISGTIFVSYVFLTAPTTILLVIIALLIDDKQNQFIVNGLFSLAASP